MGTRDEKPPPLLRSIGYDGNMSTPINLNKARKLRAKADKQARASENVAKHGLGKADKARIAAQQSASVHRLDGHKRDT
jgi:hypothetical protein